ncbi:MAG TPA: division/cell wall cluster transcriptional repressor MraZ [Gaiellales bacterium]|nr:division/cell wall cluster transcriptional repressor MraZ [Gaiellales bacterium]
MLLGESVQKLDAKNRVTLPARFREHFVEGVVVAKGLDRCLVVHSASGWERFTHDRLSHLDPFSREGRKLSRYLYAGAWETEIDRQGRVMLPQTQLAHAGLERDIVVAGLRDRLEIWDLNAWQAQQAEFEGSVEDVAESLSQH